MVAADRRGESSASVRLSLTRFTSDLCQETIAARVRRAVRENCRMESPPLQNHFAFLHQPKTDHAALNIRPAIQRSADRLRPHQPTQLESHIRKLAQRPGIRALACQHHPHEGAALATGRRSGSRGTYRRAGVVPYISTTARAEYPVPSSYARQG
jgi:hypothetical protein